MKLIVGLGNPGEKYKYTRHNIGQRVIDELSKFNFDHDIVLYKPDSFMNDSGVCVKKALKTYKAKLKDLIVIHDDLDLKLGTLKISKNRGAAGHKGIISIIKELQTKDFLRMRLGINPDIKKRVYKKQENFVIKNFSKSEEKIVKDQIQKSGEAILFILKNGIDKAMNIYNMQEYAKSRDSNS